MVFNFGPQTLLGLLAVAYMGIRSYRRASLTSSGIIAAMIVGIIHAIHPHRIILLLLVFFLTGTKLTGWGAEIKSELLTDHDSIPDSPVTVDTQTDTDTASLSQNKHLHSVPDRTKKAGRTATQVLCNSLPATLLATLHLCLYPSASPTSLHISHHTSDLLLLGIIAQYACSASDTFASEIGILDDGWPYLITTLRKVPPGTNGGVTVLGLIASLMGGLIIGVTAAIVVPTHTILHRLAVVCIATTAGLAGSLLDSLLGATLQQTLYHQDMKKVVEAHGGGRPRGPAPRRSTATGTKDDKDTDNDNDREVDQDRYVVIGSDVLDNNMVNLVSASLIVLATMGTVGTASYIWTHL